jgi:ATP-dependent Zn protease
LDGQKFYISLTDDVADDMKKLAKKLERFGKVILYIENFDYFTKYNLLNTLIPLLYGDIRIIAPIETDAYEASIFENILISSFFCLFTLYEIERKDYKKYLVPSIYELETHHEIKYSPEAIDKVILLAMTFSHSSFFEEAYNELDFAASIAKEKGRTVVNAEDVMEVIEPQLKLLNGIDKDVKFRTAIHEAGHYTVYRAMEYLKSLNFEAITIIPSGLTLGLNQFTQNVYNVNHDIDYTRDVIAFNLGGWAAEKVFFEKPSIGSSQDIQNAVLTAYDSIAYGVLGEGNQNTSTVISLITQDSRMSTSEEKGALNKTMDNEFAMGKERALEVIKEHKDFTLKLAEELCKHPIMDAKELEKLVEKYY